METEQTFLKVVTVQLVRDRALNTFQDTYDSYAELIPCECCGEWCSPEMHHRKFRSRGGDWRPSNIAALCPTCHFAVTTCRNGWSREMGLAVSQWKAPEETPMTVWYEHRPVLLNNDGGYTVVDNAD